ncbi:MAG: thiamine phosphate synthase [Candidatus Omnitrophota bacterium]
MSWKKTLLKKSRLYVIVDKQLSEGRKLKTIACLASKAGVKIIQLRFKHSKKSAYLKQALKLRKALDKKSLFIINDFPDIAKKCLADGVHLGQKDGEIVSARKILGENAIIGKSCSNLKQALKAQKEGADYIGVGPVFKTPAKPQTKTIDPATLSAISKTIKIPVFAIGGIHPNNIDKLRRCGIKRIAVIRAICDTGNINQAVKKFLNKLN